MPNKMQAFKEIKTLEDFKNELKDNSEYVYRSIFNRESLEYALNGANIMTEENAQAFLGFIHHVDAVMSQSGSAAGNRYHKTPTVLAGCIYYAYYPEKIKDLNYDELTIIAEYSIADPISSYQTNVDFFGKDLLAAIHEKGEDHTYRFMYAELAEQKLESGASHDETLAYIQETPVDELNQEGFNYTQRQLWEIGRYL